MTDTSYQIGTDNATGYPVRLEDNGDSTYSQSIAGRVGGSKSRVSLSFVRPANTTAYAAKDAINTATLTVTGATNASPIVVTCGTHGLADGDPVTIASVGGNTNANGNYYAKVTGYSATTFGVYTDQALATPKAGNSAYTSGGTVDKVLRFTNVARVAAGSGYLVKAVIMTDQTTNVETPKLHLYKSPPTAIADNAACTAPLYADAASYIGTIVFPALATEGGSSTSAYAIATSSTASSNMALAYVCATSCRDLFGLLEGPIGQTPASAQAYTIVLTAEND